MSNVSNILHPLKLRASRRARHRGQTLVEYALILAIISVVAIGALIALGNNVKSIYTTINSVIASAAASH